MRRRDNPAADLRKLGGRDFYCAKATICWIRFFVLVVYKELCKLSNWFAPKIFHNFAIFHDERDIVDIFHGADIL